MLDHKFQNIPLDPIRVLQGLARIGYTPESAICDIIDNSVRAKAKNIYLLIEREQQVADSRRNNVKEYIIIDDGIGMSKEDILNAVKLGSAGDNYEENSLSKFGLGLKSAAFSQGEILDVVSSNGSGNFIKYEVSIPLIKEIGEYGATELELDERDKEYIKKYLPEGRGTIIRIRDVRKINHPSITQTLSELKKKVGVIYYYFMLDGLNIMLEDYKCQPYDPLFIDEAKQNGNLDERTWTGTEVKWIQVPKKFPLDVNNNVFMELEATQLPHPPSCQANKIVENKSDINDKYNIASGNYGFYVYRNKRLIKWAETFENLVPFDKSLYGFRGRILINSSADESLNIDVKKSHLQLSEDAHDSFKNLCYEFISKSRRAWEHAIINTKKLVGDDPEDLADEIAKNIKFPEELPGEYDDETTYKRKEERAKQIINKIMEERKDEQKKEQKESEEGKDIEEESIKKEKQIDRRIKFNTNTKNLCLWERDWDPEYGSSVVINPSLTFSKYIFEGLRENTTLSIIICVFLLNLAHAEYHIMRNLDKYEMKDIEIIMDEFRYAATQFLIKSVSQLEERLHGEG